MSKEEAQLAYEACCRHRQQQQQSRRDRPQPTNISLLVGATEFIPTKPQLLTLVLLVSLVLLMLPGGIADQLSYVIPSSDDVTLSVQGPTHNLVSTASLNVSESYFNINCLLFNARSVVANLSDFHYTLYK